MRVLDIIKDRDNEERVRLENYASWLLRLGEENLPNVSDTP